MDDPHLGQSVPETFDRLQTDIERVEFILNCHSFIRDFELRSKYGIKSFEKTVQFRDGWSNWERSYRDRYSRDGLISC